ncbi:DUF3810 domain-containing protein [Halpernia frigidisoli]|uniref:DUF3810 domain-containing protein n=1 Tax=Halpernia frigidisoli TaxID=1125876 RepID=A0A1I3GHV3_9FLAO|nr:DUF3810 domain-containing protein [Halpernia frigidisoli]SFI23024.1 Protein of unknown function [Halpernia frigidisoli]
MVHTNKYFNIYKKRFWAGILLVQFFLFYILSKSENAIEFFNQLFELKKNVHQIIFSKIQFSVGDAFYILIVIFLLLIIVNLFKKKRRPKSAFALIIFCNIFYLIYQIFWGMLYFQKSLSDKLSKEDATINEAKKLSFKYLKLCIADRENVDENKQGIFVIKDLKSVKESILKEQKKLPSQFSTKKSTLINDFKPSLFRNVMSSTGILGYYNPFTAEAQFNEDLPATFLPFTLAHESSHQLGFARENEANFIGYLTGKNSGNKALKYSTDLFVLKSLLAFVADSDPAFIKFMISQFSPKMKADRQNDLDFVKKHNGFLNVVFDVSNNLFLKSNQQKGSITYSYFTVMLIKYERSAGQK